MNAKNEKPVGVAAAITAYVIYGLNMVVCKDLTVSGAMTPSGLVLLRTAGAAILFWAVSLIAPEEKIQKGDFHKLFLASLLGIVIPQFSTLWGLSMSTPFDASVLNLLKPFWAILASLVILGEKPQKKIWAGLALGVGGAILLLFSGTADHTFMYKTSPLGLIVLSMNGISFAVYLTLFKSLICKYSPITFMKWAFLFAFVSSLPLSLSSIPSLLTFDIPPYLAGELAFVIVVATFFTFFLSPIGQKRLSPTEFTVCSYMQPLTAAIAGIATGLDAFTVEKLLAAILITGGVVLVNLTKNKGRQTSGPIQ